MKTKAFVQTICPSDCSVGSLETDSSGCSEDSNIITRKQHCVLPPQVNDSESNDANVAIDKIRRCKYTVKQLWR